MKTLRETSQRIQMLSEQLAYKFNDDDLLLTALVHKSYSHENKEWKGKDNQRLEYLGDAVLDLIVAETLYTNADGLDEGKMTRMRADIVCEASLAAMAKTLRLDECIILGQGELADKGFEKPSILADCFEAVVAAVFLDAAYQRCCEVFSPILQSTVSMALKGDLAKDYKSLILEYAQSLDSKPPVSFVIVSSSGPTHNMIFEAKVSLLDKEAYGSGHSKKIAEQAAAKQLLSML